MSQQLTLSLEQDLPARFGSLKECIAAGVYHRGVVAVAGKIDKQPSHLSEALSGSDRRKLDVDDLELYIERTGDLRPVHYLIAKFLGDPGVAQQEALAQLAEMTKLLPGLMAAAGLTAKTGRR